MGMGCMGFSHAYGAVPEESYSISAIHQAYDKSGYSSWSKIRNRRTAMIDSRKHPAHNEYMSEEKLVLITD
ncbi:hypothetical protein QP794_07075 [Paenibacillus sp. UMB7766-LJ446]|nr:hypothetical protein [Paenibacillus sp. UMB7766-LJ446]